MEFIEKYRMNSIWGFAYNYNRIEGSQYLIIGTKNGKYGIIDDLNEVFLPFEYDCITRIATNVLQILKSGKYGIVILDNEQDEVDVVYAGRPEYGDLYISKIIPCEYDAIHLFANGHIIALVNYLKTGREIKFFRTYGLDFIDGTYYNYYELSERNNTLVMYKKSKFQFKLSAYMYDYSNDEFLCEYEENADSHDIYEASW